MCRGPEGAGVTTTPHPSLPRPAQAHDVDVEAPRDESHRGVALPVACASPNLSKDSVAALMAACRTPRRMGSLPQRERTLAWPRLDVRAARTS